MDLSMSIVRGGYWQIVSKPSITSKLSPTVGTKMASTVVVPEGKSRFISIVPRIFRGWPGVPWADSEGGVSLMAIFLWVVLSLIKVVK